MKPEKLELRTAFQILKPLDEVFEAIVDSDKMSNYFISKSDGRIEEGRILNWEFPEFEGSWPVTILKVENNKHIAFSWEGASGYKTQAEITLESRGND